MKRVLFIFRRDLRLQDNLGLISALEAGKEVILAFIFTPEQIEENSFRSDRSLQFMIESLEDLEIEISKHKGKLHLFYGKPEQIVQKCIQELAVDGVFVNHDYTPYSIQRDKKIKIVCDEHAVHFQATHDLLLLPIEDTLKGDGHPYTVFTPFYKNACKSVVCKPINNIRHVYYTKSIPFAVEQSIYKKILPQRYIQAPGGRTEGIKILNQLQNLPTYAFERDFPSHDKTTRLSAHLKFNTCSAREIYYAIVDRLGPYSEIIRSLFWRDFFTLIAFHFPHVFKGAFKTKFNNLKWENNEHMFNLWCQGKTGFPIVDAGMRELNETGFMHNRVRMVVASFLIKDLHINWQWGEKYFATHLIDYDPAVNNGNWQWAASTGCDAQPYFRIFNPWLQAKRFDDDCSYIKKWVPELQSFSPAIIHRWYLEKNYELSNDYPSPIIDHSKEAATTLESYLDISLV